MMSAFMIVYAHVDNVPQFEKYVTAARALDPVVLEGDWPFATAGVLKFDSVTAAEKFWHSPEYAAAKALRDGAANFQVVIVPAV
jgi:uncharacterized protein (DUF1330 family)